MSYLSLGRWGGLADERGGVDHGFFLRLRQRQRRGRGGRAKKMVNGGSVRTLPTYFYDTEIMTRI